MVGGYDPRLDPGTPWETIQAMGAQLADLEEQIKGEQDETRKAALQQQKAELDSQRLNLQLALKNKQAPPARAEVPPVVTPQQRAGQAPVDAGVVAQPSGGMPRAAPEEPEAAPIVAPAEPVKKTRVVPPLPPPPASPLGGGGVAPLSSIQTVSGVPYPEEQLEARKDIGEQRIGEVEEMTETAREQKEAALAQGRASSLEEAASYMPLISDAKNAAERLGLKREKIEKRMGSAAKAFGGLRQQIEDIDFMAGPNIGRIILSGMADAMRTLGSSIASGGRNMGGGAGASYVKMLIDVDLQRKKARLQKLMALQGMSERERDFLQSSLENTMKERRANMLNAAAWQTLKFGSIAKADAAKISSVDMAKELADEASKARSGIRAEQIDTEMKAREKATPKVATTVKETAVKGMGGMPKEAIPTQNIQERVSAAAGLLPELKKLWSYYQKEGGLSKGAFIRKLFPGGEASDVENWRQGLGVQQAVAVQGSRPAKEEQEIYANWFPGPYDTRAVATRKMRRQMQRLAGGLAGLIRQQERFGKDMSYARELLQDVRSHPLMGGAKQKKAPLGGAKKKK